MAQNARNAMWDLTASAFDENSWWGGGGVEGLDRLEIYPPIRSRVYFEELLSHFLCTLYVPQETVKLTEEEKSE